ncbi:MAG: hypothetical protein GY949_03310 [Gammaproteobacteria bacterium]|nr:hypothetical protein [Gammaproteobacteria bacterium]
MKAPVVRTIGATGFVTSVNTRAIGNAIIELGGGRRQVGEKLDWSVGFSEIASIGMQLDGDTPLAVVHAASDADAGRAERNLLAACQLGDSIPAGTPVIRDILTG